ncbi:MAG: imelysin family protein, partial [Balneolaceae bacterium]
MKKAFCLFLAGILAIFAHSCGDDGPSGPSSSDFDRLAMLENWADNIIIPAFASFSEETARLKSAAEEFTEEPSQPTLDEMRNAWESAYLSFQHVSMFEMGRAMELRFCDNLNVYPTDTEEIHDNIEQGSYNLELPSLTNSQGFPALDYLLYGLGSNDAEILTYYTIDSNTEAYRTYVLDLATRIDELTQEVSTHWAEEYRDVFVENSGDGANASVDMMVNDYIFY